MTWQHILNISYQDITRQTVILILNACFLWIANGIGDVIVIVLASSAVYRGFEHGSGQTKVYIIGICCYSVKHATLRRKNRDWFTRFHNSTWVSTIFSLSFYYFLLYFPNLFTIQLTFLPYFSYLFTIQLTFLPYFPYLFTIRLTFLLYCPYLITIRLAFLPYFPNHFAIQLIFLPYFPYHFTFQLAFLPYYRYLITIRLTLLPYFPYHFTIFFHIFQIISLITSIFSLSFQYFLLYFPNLFTIWLAFLP